ncbi:hypothetical protein Q8A73_014459 [Channa argus]|nr:hypothetical protein Q8A73_014459 [Channa argus]
MLRRRGCFRLMSSDEHHAVYIPILLSFLRGSAMFPGRCEQRPLCGGQPNVDAGAPRVAPAQGSIQTIQLRLFLPRSTYSCDSDITVSSCRQAQRGLQLEVNDRKNQPVQRKHLRKQLLPETLCAPPKTAQCYYPPPPFPNTTTTSTFHPKLLSNLRAQDFSTQVHLLLLKLKAVPESCTSDCKWPTPTVSRPNLGHLSGTDLQISGSEAQNVAATQGQARYFTLTN